MTHVEIPTLESQRLRLRPFHDDDAERLAVLGGAEEIASTTSAVPHPYTEAMARSWIGTHGDTFASGGECVWAMTLRGDNALVGCISLMPVSEAPASTRELGYWVGVPFWGRGFCQEAVRTVVDHAFTDAGLRRLNGRYFTRNPASGRVLANCGFEHVCDLTAMPARVGSEPGRLMQRRARDESSVPRHPDPSGSPG